MSLILKLLVSIVLLNAASAANYCGTSFSNARKCRTACPRGLNGECPSSERCYAGVSCASTASPPSSNRNYCGSSFSNARKCRTACPRGLNRECPGSELCYARVSCSSRTAPPVPGTSASFASRIVSTANSEFASYGNRHECFDSRMRRRVGQYWSSLGLRSLDGCDRNVPWSAAFISYMVRQAGGGSKMRYSSAHRDYIHDAFAGGRGLYNSVRNIDSSTVRTGDLACSGRGRISSWGFSSFATWYRRGGIRYDAIPTHCDIVVGVGGSRITVIGGNVNQRVTRKRVQKTSYAILLLVTR